MNEFIQEELDKIEFLANYVRRNIGYNEQISTVYLHSLRS